MAAVFETETFDLAKQLSIYSVKEFALLADADSRIKWEVSFDNGRTYQAVTLGKRTAPLNNSAKFKLRGIYPVADSIYTITVSGYLTFLDAGTTLYFRENRTRQLWTTMITKDGFYSIKLPPGVYTNYYMANDQQIIFTDAFNTAVFSTPSSNYEKEVAVRLDLVTADWATYAIFDTFEDGSKIQLGFGNGVEIDQYGNLVDSDTGISIAYWTLIMQ